MGTLSIVREHEAYTTAFLKRVAFFARSHQHLFSMADSDRAPVASDMKLSLLTIVLLSTETKGASDEGSKQYAMIRLPGSYKVHMS